MELLLFLVPALMAPVLFGGLLKKANHTISQAIERFMRDPAADLHELLWKIGGRRYVSSDCSGDQCYGMGC